MIIIIIVNIIAIDIHNGNNTHHHDHVILPVSFNPIKRIVNNPPKPILLFGVSNFDMIF